MKKFFKWFLAMLLFVLLFSIQPYAQSKQDILNNLQRGGALDIQDASPTTSYNVLAWDGDEVKLITIQVLGETFTTVIVEGGVAEGIDMQGAYTNAAIDLTDVVLDHSGSSGPVMIRAGTYGSPVSSSDPHQSGMVRLYGSNSAITDDGTGFYDRGIFVNLQVTGNKGAFPIAGLIEVRNVGSEAGPTSVMAGQFIVGLHTSTSKLAATVGSDDGMFASWFKIYSTSGSVAASTSRVAAIWLDNSMGGTVSGEHYSAFITSGGAAKPDAIFGFETGAGWEALFYFDETAYDKDPISNLGAKNEVNSDKSIKIDLNGTVYYIPIFVVGNME